jgi:glutaredoxin
MFKTILAAFFGLLLYLGSAIPIWAQETVTVYVFSAQGCPHCAEEKEYLADYLKANSDVIAYELEITRYPENVQLLRALGEQWRVDVSGVPLTVVGDQTITGFLNRATTGKAIEQLIGEVREQGDTNAVQTLAQSKQIQMHAEAIQSQAGEKQTNPSPKSPDRLKTPSLPQSVTLPFLGEVDLRDLSLPVVTVVLALMDGFNPCAMWVLIFLIGLLLGMKDRKKMWLLGGTFLLASALVYFLILAAWLNLLLFLGFVIWIRLLIGLVALGAGVYYLRDFWVNREGACTVIEPKKRQKWFTWMRRITQKRQLLLAMGGMALLAFGVNLVELVCSAGLPAVYTQILTLNPLPRVEYYAYLLLYILVFLIDDLLVFSGAMITLKATGVEGKYSRFSHLVGGIAMVLVGLLLWLKPEWLMFG